MRRAGWLVLAAAVSLVAGVLAQRWVAGPTGMPAGNPQFPDLEGHPHAVSEWRGKVVVVNFWATWCPPCREEIPEFVRMQTEFGAAGLQFIGIALDEPAAVQGFLREVPLNYPVLIGDDRAARWAERLGNRWGALPFSVVFDRHGTPVRIKAGIFRREPLLDVVEPLLPPKSGAN